MAKQWKVSAETYFPDGSGSDQIHTYDDPKKALKVAKRYVRTYHHFMDDPAPVKRVKTGINARRFESADGDAHAEVSFAFRRA